jgi:hypothetical protein
MATQCTALTRRIRTTDAVVATGCSIPDRYPERVTCVVVNTNAVPLARTAVRDDHHGSQSAAAKRMYRVRGCDGNATCDGNESGVLRSERRDRSASICGLADGGGSITRAYFSVHSVPAPERRPLV